MFPCDNADILLCASHPRRNHRRQIRCRRRNSGNRKRRNVAAYLSLLLAVHSWLVFKRHLPRSSIPNQFGSVGCRSGSWRQRYAGREILSIAFSPPQAPEDWRTPRRFAFAGRWVFAPASWTAAARRRQTQPDPQNVHYLDKIPNRFAFLPNWFVF